MTKLSFHGRPVQPSDSFTLCMNNFRATGNGGYDCWRDCPTVSVGADGMSELILRYILDHPVVNIPENRSFRVIQPTRKTDSAAVQ